MKYFFGGMVGSNEKEIEFSESKTVQCKQGVDF
jgi:hypothetical protein